VTAEQSLAELAGIESDQRRAAQAEVLAEIERRGLHTVRLAFADLHGLLRGKALRADLVDQAFADGLGITSALLMKDTGQQNVYPVWADGAGLGKPWLTGAGDVMMLPDPSTFRVLPWADGTGWLLCDLYSPDGDAVSFDTRAVCRRAEQALADRGYGLKAGLEVEFHLYRLADGGRPAAEPPSAALDLVHTHPGRVYLGEQRLDLIEPFLDLLRRDLTALGLPPRSLEVELGPSQVELTFSPAGAGELADRAVLLRSAVKQIARRNGLHATFMSRPGFPGSFTSGWHLHQSLVDIETGRSAMTVNSDDGSNSGDRPDSDDRSTGTEGPAVGMLSAVGGHYVAGLLEHAAASCLLTTPTITGYKRYQPESLAPFRASWGRQHRGAMLRLVGGGSDPATRIENRVGDSAANPYLYVASQLWSGLWGLEAKEEPPAISASPYEQAAGPRLPSNLAAAIEAFAGSSQFRTSLGDEFVDYVAGVKQAEWDRFLHTVTDWEQTEYLELF
jgi:glutamine synthetase